MQNNNTRKIILILGILVVVLILFFIVKNVSFAPVVAPTQESAQTESIGGKNNQIEPQLPAQTLPLSNSAKEIAWALFQKYLGFNKDQNLDAVKSVVYKVNPVCATAVASDECKNRMDLAYSYGSALKKEDFTNVWSDSRQTILATDFKIEEDDSAIGRNRAIIFFVDGKLLSFSPFKGTVLPKEASTTRAELLSKLILYTEDKDEDGIADYDEQCLSVPAGQTCTKTSPTLRDTNGNGLWDGVDALINSMK